MGTGNREQFLAIFTVPRSPCPVPIGISCLIYCASRPLGGRCNRLIANSPDSAISKELFNSCSHQSVSRVLHYNKKSELNKTRICEQLFDKGLLYGRFDTFAVIVYDGRKHNSQRGRTTLAIFFVEHYLEISESGEFTALLLHSISDSIS